MTALRQLFVIRNSFGLHARAAAAVVKLCTGFDAQLEVHKDGRIARATSMMELLMLCAEAGTTVEVVAQGRDAEAALQALGQLIDERFGESN